MNHAADISYTAKFQGATASSCDIFISMPELSATTDLKYEQIYTRDMKKFDLLMTCESLIKNGVVETGREWKSSPVYKVTTFTGSATSSIITVEHQ